MAREKDQTGTVLKLCDICVKRCLFELTKISGSYAEAKCDMCKKLKPVYSFRVVTKGDRAR